MWACHISTGWKSPTSWGNASGSLIGDAPIIFIIPYPD